MKTLKKMLLLTLALALLATVLMLPAMASSDPSSKLLAAYTFDDETVSDSVGINHGVFYNGKSVADPTFTEGVHGQALQLSSKGTAQMYWLQIPMDIFDGNQDSFTITMWYKATGYNTTGEDSELFSFYNTSIENFLFYSPASMDFQDKGFSMKWNGLSQSYGYANVITPYFPDNWVHLVYAIEAVDGQSKITAYVNGKGVEVDQGGDWSNSLMSALGVNNFTIGGKNPYKGGDVPSCLFFGAVDEVKIYAGALNAEEAAFVYGEAGYEATDAPDAKPVDPQPTDAPTEAPSAEASETQASTEAAPTEAPTEATTEDTEPAGGQSAGNLGIWIVVAALILVLGALGVALILKKK